jgi:hypothetical protein
MHLSCSPHLNVRFDAALPRDRIFREFAGFFLDTLLGWQLWNKDRRHLPQRDHRCCAALSSRRLQAMSFRMPRTQPTSSSHVYHGARGAIQSNNDRRSRWRCAAPPRLRRVDVDEAACRCCSRGRHGIVAHAGAVFKRLAPPHPQVSVAAINRLHSAGDQSRMIVDLKIGQRMKSAINRS